MNSAGRLETGESLLAVFSAKCMYAAERYTDFVC